MLKVVVGVFLIVLGVSALYEINLWHFFWPAVLILAGVWFILDRPGHYSAHHRWKEPSRFQEGETVKESTECTLNYSASFQGIDRKIVTDDFRGGSIDATFGGVNLDLRNAKIKRKDPVILRVDATLGGIKIRVPKTWQIENHLAGFAGGVHDITAHPSEKERNGILKLMGQATLGGIEVTN